MEDQGNAWGRLGHALAQLGQRAEALEAYRTGVRQAQRHGHPSMALEFEEIIEELLQ
jgi:E3 SUMO-protein ligase RanBP2